MNIRYSHEILTLELSGFYGCGETYFGLVGTATVKTFIKEKKMSESQVHKMVAGFVSHQKFFDAMLTEDVQWVIQNPKKAIKLFIGVVEGREKLNLLELITTVNLPACDKFVVKDEFRTDRDDINLLMLGDFRKFCDKVEKDIPATTVYISKLLRSSRNLTNKDGSPGIIANLNGNEETTLYHLLSLLLKQSNDEDGVLHTNGKVNVFYIRDAEGVLCPVCTLWDCNAWFLSVYSVENLNIRDSESFVISCEYA